MIRRRRIVRGEQPCNSPIRAETRSPMIPTAGRVARRVHDGQQQVDVVLADHLGLDAVAEDLDQFLERVR
ncbi:MAG: hypothetical protein U0R67_01825 [Micropruina glycogenica]